MKKIKHIVEQIEDEIHGAEDYAKCAVKSREEDKELSEMYRKLAEVELEHANELHEQVARIIKEYREERKEPHAAMQAVWDWEHEKMIDNISRIKAILKQC